MDISEPDSQWAEPFEEAALRAFPSCFDGECCLVLLSYCVGLGVQTARFDVNKSHYTYRVRG